MSTRSTTTEGRAAGTVRLPPFFDGDEVGIREGYERFDEVRPSGG